MNINSVLSEKIKHCRKTYGMTQEEFAAELGVESLHISNIERGKKGASLELLLNICKRFNVSMSSLMPVEDQQSVGLKAKWIDEIVETLEALELSQIGLIKTMICSLKI